MTTTTEDLNQLMQAAGVTSPPEDISQVKADWETHHIEGIAREGNIPFSASLISHIDGNLWVGGCIGGVRLPDDFKFVVSLYPWEQYTLGPETVRIEHTLYDSSDQELPERQIYDLARIVNAFLNSGKTVIHCQAGLNRSNLIAGLALILQGYRPEKAIALLRERRSSAVLCNRMFEEWLLAQEKP